MHIYISQTLDVKDPGVRTYSQHVLRLDYILIAVETYQGADGCQAMVFVR